MTTFQFEPSCSSSKIETIPIDYHKMKKQYLKEIQAVKGCIGYMGSLTSKAKMQNVIETFKKGKNKLKERVPLSIKEERCLRMYDVIEDANEKKIVEPVMKNGVRRVYTLPEDSFDIILEAHRFKGHGSSCATRMAVQKKYIIHPRCYDILLRLCNVCQYHKNKGVNDQERDNRQKYKKWCVFLHTVGAPDDPFRHIMMVKDLRTHFTHLKPLTVINIHEIAQELLKICTDFGPPTILESKHVEYFREICDVIKTICPEYKIKSQQWKAEPYLDWVLQMKSFLSDWSKKNDTVHWSLGCPIVQWRINNSGDKVITPHKALFGDSIPFNKNTFNLLSEQRNLDEVIKIDDDDEQSEIKKHMVTLSSVNKKLNILERSDCNKTLAYTPEVDDIITKLISKMTQNENTENQVTLNTINETLRRLDNDDRHKIQSLLTFTKATELPCQSLAKDTQVMPSVNTVGISNKSNVRNAVAKEHTLSVDTVISNLIGTKSLSQNDDAKNSSKLDTFSLDDEINDMMNRGSTLEDIIASNSIVSIHTFPLKALVSSVFSDGNNTEKSIDTTPVISEVFSIDAVLQDIINSGKSLPDIYSNNAVNSINITPHNTALNDVRNTEEILENDCTKCVTLSDQDPTSNMESDNKTSTDIILENKSDKTDVTFDTTFTSNSFFNDMEITEKTVRNIRPIVTSSNSRNVVHKSFHDVFVNSTELIMKERKLQDQHRFENPTSHDVETEESSQDTYASMINSTMYDRSADISEQDMKVQSSKQIISVESIISDLTATERALQDENAKISLVSVEFSDDENEDVLMEKVSIICGHCKLLTDGDLTICQRCHKPTHPGCSKQLRVQNKPTTTCYTCLIELKVKIEKLKSSDLLRISKNNS